MGNDNPLSIDSTLAQRPHRDWKRWNEENKPAVDAYNARIAHEGLPLARYRTFMTRMSKPSTPSSEPID